MPRIALVAHGAGSCAATALRLLGPALPPHVDAVPVDARGGIADVVRRMHDAAHGREVALAAGISLGAHATAAWALEGGSADSLLLVMPAWTAAPDAVAALTSASADAIEQRGIAAVLADIRAQAPDDWVVRELAAGWSTYDARALALALRAAAASAAPTLDDLSRITARTAVVALADDPLHPEAVARAWAAAIPGATLAVVPRDAPATDPGALGRAALEQPTDLRP